MTRKLPSSNFVREVERFQPQLYLAEAVRDTLVEFLGETAARLTIYHLGDALHDPNALAQRMTELFGSGGRIMLDHMAVKCKHAYQDANANPKILVIDDDVAVCETLRLVFEKTGYQVDVVNTGQEALQKSKETSYNAALIDIRLPDMNGVELLTQLSQPTSDPKMVKIMVTGYATQENAIEALNEGADAYILKPFKPDELIVTVKQKLDEQTESLKMTQDKIAEFIKDRIKALESKP